MSIIPLDPKIYSLRDCRILEQYYLDQLNSVLNVQRFVNIPELSVSSGLTDSSNRDTAKPIFVYGPDLKRVLYIFKSKTSIYLEFKIHRITLDKFLDKTNLLYLDYFYFSSSPGILPESEVDNTVDLTTLLDLKSNAPIKPKRGNIQILLTDTLHGGNQLAFKSYTAAARYIKNITGKSDRTIMVKYALNKTLYQDRWLVEEFKEE